MTRFTLLAIIGIICCLCGLRFGAEAALLKLSHCSQSSQHEAGGCSRAIDRVYKQHWSGNSCTHTQGGIGNWWTAHLTTESRITHVKIYNRMDCCSDRLNNFEILVDGRTCASYHAKDGNFFNVKTFKCVATGSAITVLSHKNAALTLCEIEVHGEYVKPDRSTLLKFKHCSQTSTIHNGRCERAMDRIYKQNYNENSCTHTQIGLNNWWRGQLEHRARIKQVRLYNRLDGSSSRLNNFDILVDGKKCASYYAKDTSYFAVKTFNCRAVGKTVTVKSHKNAHLTLCEIDVHGKYLKDIGEKPRQLYEYLGCYADDHTRDLSTLFQKPLMTLEVCFLECGMLGYKYLGLQHGHQCHCGNSYGRYGKRDDSQCNMKCNGNDRQKCGGELRNSIYSINMKL